MPSPLEKSSSKQTDATLRVPLKHNRGFKAKNLTMTSVNFAKSNDSDLECENSVRSAQNIFYLD